MIDQSNQVALEGNGPAGRFPGTKQLQVAARILPFNRKIPTGMACIAAMNLPVLWGFSRSMKSLGRLRLGLCSALLQRQ